VKPKRKTDEAGGRSSPLPPTRSYVDADGAPTENPALAVRGEIVEYGADGHPAKRSWFLTSQADLSWLPISESAFLLWVLAFLVVVWLGVGLALYAF
jgi:hypothetical protein